MEIWVNIDDISIIIDILAVQAKIDLGWKKIKNRRNFDNILVIS